MSEKDLFKEDYINELMSIGYSHDEAEEIYYAELEMNKLMEYQSNNASDDTDDEY